MKGPWSASAKLSMATDAGSDRVILITALISVARHADVAAKAVGHHVNLALGWGDVTGTRWRRRYRFLKLSAQH